MLHDIGVPAKVAQQQLGHAAVETTLKVYTHAIPGTHLLAVENLKRVLIPNVLVLVRSSAAENSRVYSITHTEPSREPFWHFLKEDCQGDPTGKRELSAQENPCVNLVSGGLAIGAQLFPYLLKLSAGTVRAFEIVSLPCNDLLDERTKQLLACLIHPASCPFQKAVQRCESLAKSESPHYFPGALFPQPMQALPPRGCG